MVTYLGLLFVAVLATPCENLPSLAIGNGRIAESQIISAGSPRVQGTSWPGMSPQAGRVPEFCRVAAVLAPTSDSNIKIEVWLPTQNWNGKFQAGGNGRWGGSMQAYPVMQNALISGYATAGTDTGHTGEPTDGSFAVGHPEKVIDFAHRSIHEMTVAAKTIIEAFYGRGPQYSYFNGCSTGGRQALMEAQRYPGDYDGILAGASAVYPESEANASILNAMNPDLSRFKESGGKLLMYHGLEDPLITPKFSVDYYLSVLKAMGDKQDDWLKLFLVPTMQHCGGIPSINRIDVMTAMEHWRERGVAPTQMVGRSSVNPTPEATY